MNSGIQCLRHAMDLSDFFVRNEYKKDINEDNPLGMKGQVAVTFAELLTEMWQGSNSEISPYIFKAMIGMDKTYSR